MQMADERIIAWPSRQLMWDIADVKIVAKCDDDPCLGLPEGCAVYVREDVANAVWNEAVEACIARMKEIAKRAENQGRADDASLCESLALNLDSLKRSDKESGNG
jgi:hypothetical protein